MSIIHGFLERISYHNEENDFVVAKLLEKDKKELTTIVGNLSGINRIAIAPAFIKFYLQARQIKGSRLTVKIYLFPFQQAPPSFQRHKGNNAFAMGTKCKMEPMADIERKSYVLIPVMFIHDIYIFAAYHAEKCRAVCFPGKVFQERRYHLHIFQIIQKIP